MVDRPVILSLTTMREEGMALLRAAGEVRMARSLDPDELRVAIADADALVVRTAGRIDARLLDAAARLRVIGRHGVGYDQIAGFARQGKRRPISARDDGWPDISGLVQDHSLHPFQAALRATG